ncbi:diguanylate cyclase [Aceticella autotrophica]|uniref:Diguanylate cyclase n=1 Tax=Aceticella autotrophica TaxID=2755338 RepID=A0A975AWS1_9THEO|nr:diguanylate cyclase [Aceticella autotrophica]
MIIIIAILVSFAVSFVVISAYDEVIMSATDRVKYDIDLFQTLLEQKYPGAWNIKNGKLYKGNVQLNDNYDVVDCFTSISGNTTTIFQGDTRISTSIKNNKGERVIGTKADPEVAETVLKQGKNYFGIANVVGEKYITAYKPIKDNEGEIIGMVYTGIPLSSFDIVKKRLILRIGFPSFLFLIFAITEIMLIVEWINVRKLALTDSLTNAYNRRYFTQMLEREIEYAKRTGLTFSIIMVDLDHFKNVNDRFGHAAGDLVLKSLVNMIKQRIRKTDCIARWGGEEFLILLPNTPVDKGAYLAEELRKRLSRMVIPKVGHVTASFGVTGYCEGDTIDTLVMRADSMMYKAKSSGRNCVRFTDKCK